jgi:hypothetical protein
MSPKLECVNVRQDIRSVRDEFRDTPSYRRTIYDTRLSNALVTYANGTR